MAKVSSWASTGESPSLMRAILPLISCQRSAISHQLETLGGGVIRDRVSVIRGKTGFGLRLQRNPNRNRYRNRDRKERGSTESISMNAHMRPERSQFNIQNSKFKTPPPVPVSASSWPSPPIRIYSDTVSVLPSGCCVNDRGARMRPFQRSPESDRIPGAG